MLLRVSTPSSDPVTQELQALRQSIDVLAERVGELAADNLRLRNKLEACTQARADLLAQTEHVIHQLDLSRKEVRELKGAK